MGITQFLITLAIVAGVPALFLILDSRDDSDQVARAGLSGLLLLILIAAAVTVVVSNELAAAGINLWEVAQ